jgi:hypothetical protein
MRRFLTLVTFVLGLAAAPASAQCPDDIRSNVQRELEITDARIEQAETVVSTTDHREARSDLALAIEIQARARVELAAGRCALALDLTRRARARASHAISLVRGLPDPDQVRVQLDRTSDVLERARDRVEECSETRARSLLHAAAEMQLRAETAFRSEPPRLLAALQLTISARERAQRALRLCNVEDGVREGAERALRRTEDVLERARDRVARSAWERARQALQQAIEIQGRAQEEFRAGRFEASLRLTQQARAFAFRAIRMSERQ